ncbi:MAG: porin, partial [Cruoricaptor ignavus]|nr:porin [Cruoricaptor ignavus]
MKKLLTLAIFSLLGNILYSQGSPEYGGGLKVNLNDNGEKYLRFILWNQIWLRNSQLNPGSMVADEATDNAWVIGNRRLRLLALAQISKRYMIVTHIGVNNQYFNGGGIHGSSGSGGYGVGKKTGLFFHDAWNEYAVVLPEKEKKFSLSVGAGLHYYMGLSRLTQASTL